MNGIYLGNEGFVELERVSTNLPIYSKLDPEDVNVGERRWSVDNDLEALITGDRLEISTVDGSNLQLVAGHNFPDGLWFCHIDPIGGIYLYEDYEQAINGKQSLALPLVAPTQAQDITIALGKEGLYRCVANIRDWSLTTSREAVDLTSLGEEYRRNYTNGLISGQGSLNCFWDYKSCACESGERVAYPQYMSQLVLRTKLGGAFRGRFFILGGPDTYIWNEALCIITNVAMSFGPTQPVGSRIEFVTSGAVALRMGMPPSYLLQEDADFILQEDGEKIGIAV